MDESRTELIVQLCAAAGAIMEDASAAAILMSGSRDEPRDGQITELLDQARQAVHLLVAADALASAA